MVPDDKKLFGIYVGFVRDTDDPERRARVRFYVPEVVGDEDSADTWSTWALPVMPLASAQSGAMLVPPAPSELPGSTANDRTVAYWITYRHGDPAYPVYMGGFWYGQGDVPGVPPQAEMTARRPDPSASPPSGTLVADIYEVQDGVPVSASQVREPRPASEATYPANRFYKSPSGHVIEADDTVGAERVKIFHRNGTYFEMSNDGSMITKVVGLSAHFSQESLRHIAASAKELFDGPLHRQCKGPVTEICLSDRSTTVVGRDSVTAQRWLVMSEADAVIETQELHLQGSSTSVLASGGDALVTAPDVLVLGIQSLVLQNPTGVVLTGITGKNGATEFILGGSSFAQSCGTLAGTVTGACAPVIEALKTLNMAPVPAAMILPAVAALVALASGIALGASSALTIHRASKV